MQFSCMNLLKNFRGALYSSRSRRTGPLRTAGFGQGEKVRLTWLEDQSSCGEVKVLRSFEHISGWNPVVACDGLLFCELQLPLTINAKQTLCMLDKRVGFCCHQAG